MTAEPAYLDTSAIVKLVWPEPETEALRTALGHWPDRMSSVLARVEVHRALIRVGASRAVRVHADAVLSRLTLVHVDEPVLALAGRLPGRDLRALDALHLATALSIGDLPAAFVTYDGRLARAARRQGLDVFSPGADIA